MKKRILSLLLAVCLIIEVIDVNTAISAQANEKISDGQPDLDMNMSISGTNSIGNLISKEIDNEMDLTTDSEEQGYSIVDVSMDGDIATVSYNAIDNCTLIVSIYDNDGIAMLASGNIEIETDTDEYSIDVTIDIDTMPEYYYVRANLVDNYTYAPLCEEFESSLYTQEIQEFLEMDINDFDQERVVNFDESEETNFAVFSDETIIVSEEDINSNIIEDDDNGLYVIENADVDTKNLQVGDIYAYEKSDGELVILKVGDIFIDGNTVSIYEDDTELEEVFDFVRIEEDADAGDAEIDETNKDESVTFDRIVEEDEDFLDEIPQSKIYNDISNSILLASTDNMSDSFNQLFSNKSKVSGKKKLSIESSIKEKEWGTDNNKAKLSAKVKVSTELSAELYIAWTKRYLKVEFDNSFGFSGEFSGEIKKEVIPIFTLNFYNIPGVKCSVDLNVVVKFSGTVSFNVNVKDIGFEIRYESRKLHFTQKTPKADVDVEAEAELFVGLSLVPSITLINNKIAKVEIEFMAGFDTKATMRTPELDDLLETNDSKHDCDRCLSGSVDFKVSGEGSLKLLNCIKIKKELEVSINLFDFYHSFTHNKGGIGECPYQYTKVTFNVFDQNNNPLSGVTIKDKYSNQTLTTGEDGFVTDFVQQGKRKFSYSKEGYIGFTDLYNAEIGDKKVKITNKMYKLDSLQSGTDNTTEENTTEEITTEEETTEEDVVNERGLEINEENFPDSSFRNFVKYNYDSDYSGDLSIDEIEKIESISITWDSSIKDLTGINNFIFLKEVHLVSLHKLNKGLDFSDCNDIEVLDLEFSSLGDTELDVSNMANLYKIDCRCTGISNIKFGDNSLLEYIDISSTNINKFDVSCFPNLKYLDVGLLELSSLDVSKNTELEYLSMNSLNKTNQNTFKTIDLSNNKKLKYLKCNRAIEKLDLSNNPELEELDCEYSSISSIDVTKNPKLKKIVCGRTKISSINLKNNPELTYLWLEECYNIWSLDISNNDKLEYIYCDSLYYVSSLDLKDKKNLKVLNISGMKISNINTSDFTKLEKLDIEDCINIKNLNLSENTELESLNFSGNNNIKSIDLSDNTKLKYLYFERTPISSIDLSNNVYLEYVYCTSSQISELDLTNNNNIRYVECSNGVNVIGYSGNVNYSKLNNIFLENNYKIADAFPEIEPLEKTYLGTSLGDITNEPDDNTQSSSDNENQSFTGLVPNERYLFYVWADKEAENPLSSDNLLYIKQVESDNYGNVTIEYIPTMSDDTAEKFVVWGGKYDISQASVDIDNLTYNGDEQVVEPIVTYDGDILEEGKDYYLEGDFCATDIGNYTINVIGTGFYTGSKSIDYEVASLTVLVDSISISESDLTMEVDDKKLLSVVISPVDATDKSVIWTSDNENIVTVDEYGMVLAVSEGTVNITAKANDESGVSASCVITVKKATDTKPENSSDEQKQDKNEEQKDASDKEDSSSVVQPPLKDDSANDKQDKSSDTDKTEDKSDTDKTEDKSDNNKDDSSITNDKDDTSGDKQNEAKSDNKIAEKPKPIGTFNVSYLGNSFYKDYSGDIRCYDYDGNMVINGFRCDGIYTYYFQLDGTAMKDRLTYHPDGEHVIYFDSEGHEVFSDFANVRKTIAGDEVNDFCFFDVFGYMYVDVLTYDKTGSVLYYANPYGVMEMGKWFQFSDTVMWADGTPAEGIAGGYGYANEDGTLMTNTATYDWEGRSCYLQGNGVASY